MLREAMELPDMVKKESGRSFRCDRHVCRNEVYSLGDGVYYSHDGIMSGSSTMKSTLSVSHRASRTESG